MATATMATAAGAAALLYYTLNKNCNQVQHLVMMTKMEMDIILVSSFLMLKSFEFVRRENIAVAEGNLHVSREFGGKDSLQLKGPEIAAELRYLLNLLTLCWHFSKKPFPLFLEETGYSQEDVILQEPKAGILKPAFTVLVDHKTKTFLLLIRGTHSVKDTLTAVTGAVVPFHHTVVCEGGVSNLVLGYAHGGMVAAARWIAKLATPCLLTALNSYPDYKLKIVGHSLGGGTAALLTYILRERKELSTSTCLAFAPAACMTWELAESGNDFLTSVINGADLVPTFSAASVDDLRAELSWLKLGQACLELILLTKENTLPISKLLISLGADLTLILSPFGPLKRHEVNVVMKRAQSMAQAAWSRPSLRISSWSCIGPRRRSSTPQINSNITEDSSETSSTQIDPSEPFLTSVKETTTVIENSQLPIFSSEGNIENSYNSINEITLADNDDIMERMTEVELWQQIERELYEHEESEEADIMVNEIREEEEAVIAEVSDNQSQSSVPNTKEVHRFFPAGKIMHIVTLVSDDEADRESDSDDSGVLDHNPEEDTRVAIFLTPRSLYSKLRLSQRMIADHFMPVYRRQIEKLIRVLENEGISDSHDCGEEIH
ncbi:hypothetical protein DH2020_013200 [Rehmannia glutinosa]|uniref:Fungal lipase-type domain-containing protein n=1 Tax=Rehmannia glutinosa TaxID=99300 RepID=A0ABR0X1U6_REHGL